MKKTLAVLLSVLFCTVCLTSGVWAKENPSATQDGQGDKVKVVAKEKLLKEQKQERDRERSRQEVKENRGQTKKAEKEAQIEKIRQQTGQQVKNYGQAKKLEERIRVRGRYLKYDVPPVIKEGRTLIPVRAIMNGLGAKVDWDKEKKIVTIKQDKQEVIFKLDVNEVLVNGKTVTIDMPAQLICNRTFVPLRFLSETLGEKVNYDEDTGEIDVGEEEENEEDVDEDVDEDIDEEDDEEVAEDNKTKDK
ncbi:MAG: copper amine oxidase N-terminal domain-containing protein [Peptococcia bacterium]|jgi:hypothetical protein